ncbi:MAG: alpha/beta hydrolase-fold protein [Bacteroidales bacterium]
MTTAPLPSELYSYLFVVDGIATADPNHPYVFRDFATISNVFVVGGGPGDLYAVQDVPHGTLSHRWYLSESLGRDRRINIYTPPGYEAGDATYPVLYLLHGYGGDEDEWVSFGRATQILDNLIAKGEAKPMLVVMPNGHTAMEAAPGESSLGFYKPGRETDRSDVPGSFEKGFREILDFVEANYRVAPDRSHRAIAGLSMGGGHAITISGMYENSFDYVGVFSSAHSAMRSNSEESMAQFDGMLKTQIENGLQLYWVGIGTEDFLFEANTQFRARLDELGMDYIYVETGGGHIWKCWRTYLGMFVPLLFH